MAGANDDIETLGKLDILSRRYFVDRSLMESICIGGHFEVERRIGGLEEVGAGCETSGDRVCVGGARGEVMRRGLVGLEFFLVTGAACFVADVVLSGGRVLFLTG